MSNVKILKTSFLQMIKNRQGALEWYRMEVEGNESNHYIKKQFKKRDETRDLIFTILVYIYHITA